MENCRKTRLRHEDIKGVFMLILSVGMLVLRSNEDPVGDVTLADGPPSLEFRGIGAGDRNLEEYSIRMAI